MLTVLVLAAQLAAHVHGQAEMSIVQDDDVVDVRLTADMGSLVGFEHAPRTERERVALAEATAILEEPAKVFDLGPERAACRVDEVDVTLPSGDDHAEHRDVEAAYRLTCKRAGEIGAVRVQLFDAFPGIETVDVVALTDRAQAGGTVRASDREVRF